MTNCCYACPHYIAKAKAGDTLMQRCMDIEAWVVDHNQRYTPDSDIFKKISFATQEYSDNLEPKPPNNTSTSTKPIVRT